MPIDLPIGVERERVIEAMLNQVREVAHLVKDVPAATAAAIPPPVEDEG